MNKFYGGILSLFLIVACQTNSGEKATLLASQESNHYIRLINLDETRQFYTWTADRIPLVSAHRGGPYPGFPENAIETFENVLRFTPAIIELDVAMTKDSVLVLMHDDELDRTTTGTGKVEDVTYEYIQGLFLEDNDGKKTDFKVSTLEEALNWSKGKALLTVDIKRSVPFEMVVDAVRETESEPYAALISYTFPAAKKLHELAPELMLSVTIRNEDEIRRFEETGIPWTRVIAFTGVAERNPEFNKALHEKGVFTILGVLGNLDRMAESRGVEVYASFVQKGADILATDRPIEAAKVLKSLSPSTSSKSPYFTHVD
ncbi:glycerophosphodiester phosphodiesterase family protein [Algoriphagus vanfongensis]|uniref:glycerophosphodiester phosphodiesterase family protein n=1 Tax=Algoriphagus vanfongensis TaxID=426371 RepID=UPI0005506CA0|nr:glycerophosphodiester phosphodiesterase family protein [Algoriphagus vanfongensis]